MKAISPTSVVVVWRGVLPSTEEEPISGYKVRYWEADKDYTSAKEVFKYLDGNDLEAVVPGLTPGKVYKLRVMAFSIGGDGKMSSPPWEFRVGKLPKINIHIHIVLPILIKLTNHVMNNFFRRRSYVTINCEWESYHLRCGYVVVSYYLCHFLQTCIMIKFDDQSF